MVDSACARFVAGNSPKHDNITTAKKIALNFTKTPHEPFSHVETNSSPKDKTPSSLLGAADLIDRVNGGFLCRVAVLREEGNKSKALHLAEIHTVVTVFFDLFCWRVRQLSLLFSTKVKIWGNERPSVGSSLGVFRE